MRGSRPVRRLVGVVAGLALVGPLSVAARPDVATAAPTGYVTMSDGASIAVNVRMPTNYVPGLRYPTVFEMSGYDGGSANGGTLAKDVGVPPGTPVPVDDSRQLTDLLDGEYVTVHASVRGTGCSSGEFDLFSWRSALDGKEIIDNWIPNQPWSNGAVGLLGHSYGGITGFMVGDHNTESTADYGVPDIRNDRKAWLDQWVRGVNGGFGNLEQARSSVSVLFETHKETQVDEETQTEKELLVPNGRKDAKTFPLPDTSWTDWYLHGDGSLTTSAPTAEESPQPYVTGTKRQFWSYQAGGDVGPPLTTAAGPDELSYRSEPVAADTAIAGPITATLFLQSTAPDTELFVELVDEGPDGSRTYLQRGVLRASHRVVDDSQSDHTPDGRIYRPHRPHTNPTNITPGQTYEYLVEVWPVGHVFRAGHRVSVKVHTPPFVDSFYAYVPRSAPGVNTVLQGPDTPSRIMLPMVPLTSVQLGPPLPCGAQEAVRCVAQPG